MDWTKLSPLPIENVYHFCAVVPDLDRAIREVGDQLRAQFAPVKDTADFPTRGPDGRVVESQLRVTYSIQGPPYFELVQGNDNPDSVWFLGEGPRLHHIGYHVSDWKTEVRRLEDLGMQVEATLLNKPVGGGDYTERGGCYMNSPFGIRVEVIDVTRRDSLWSWLHGDLPMGTVLPGS